MRIAYLCKRLYMSKDVILDRYARLYEIPRQLALIGHEVDAHCLAYDDSAELHVTHDALPGALRWHSRAWGRWKVPRLIGYPSELLKKLRAFDPDLVIGASDIPHIVLADWISRQLRRPFVADLYDNFEGFGQARIPGMVRLLRRAVSSADLVLTTSEPLRELVVDEYGARGEVISMPSTIDKDLFHPREKAEARAVLGLPEDALLVGTAGGLYRDKGIGTLYDAWALLEERRPEVHLVLAGPHETAFPPPSGERVHFLGPLEHERVADIFCALDVGAICVLDTPFGRYCFPQKAYEMLASGLPIVAADVGAMSRLLDAWSATCLYPSGDPGALADRIERQLDQRLIPPVPVEDWRAIIGRIESRLPRR